MTTITATTVDPSIQPIVHMAGIYSQVCTENYPVTGFPEHRKKTHRTLAQTRGTEYNTSSVPLINDQTTIRTFVDVATFFIETTTKQQQ